jgi:hypothetical protein
MQDSAVDVPVYLVGGNDNAHSGEVGHRLLLHLRNNVDTDERL